MFDSADFIDFWTRVCRFLDLVSHAQVVESAIPRRTGCLPSKSSKTWILCGSFPRHLRGKFRCQTSDSHVFSFSALNSEEKGCIQSNVVLIYLGSVCFM